MEINNQKDSYNDIINLSHHVSSTRPQMAQHVRAAQFSPFAALTGYDAEISETARLTNKRLKLSEDKKADLNERMQILLENVQDRPLVTITYFISDERKTGGSYKSVSGSVRRVDEYELLIIFTDGTTIPMGDIYNIEGEIFSVIDSVIE